MMVSLVAAALLVVSSLWTVLRLLAEVEEGSRRLEDDCGDSSDGDDTPGIGDPEIVGDAYGPSKS